MSENNMEYRSLCSNCKNAPDCVFKKKHQKPYLYCEEFEVATCPPVETTRKDKSPQTSSVDIEEDDSGKFIGLCSNCDNRGTCAFPKPQGGVWHCEEYQ